MRSTIVLTPDFSQAETILRENPNLPWVDPMSNGVRHAVVSLQNVEQARSKSWSHPPVAVELSDYRFHVKQGYRDSHIGIVRAGDVVTFVSRQNRFHSIHGQGAAFFQRTLPDPDKPVTIRFDKPGIVELTSAAGYYWMRAYLFVVEHPYCTLTDGDGKFTLEQIPNGEYEMACWMPNWNKKAADRDPESGMWTRWYFADPYKKTHQIRVKAGSKEEAGFRVNASDFHAE